MVLAHFVEVGLPLCFEVRFTPSRKSFRDRAGRELQVYLQSQEKSEGTLCVFVCARLESWPLNWYGHRRFYPRRAAPALPECAGSRHGRRVAPAQRPLRRSVASSTGWGSPARREARS